MQILTRIKQATVSIQHLGFATRLNALFRRLIVLRDERLTVAELQSLDDHTLKDIGLTRSEIAATVYRSERKAARKADETPRQEPSPANSRILRI